MNARISGLWIVHFDAGAAHGKGLAVLQAGEILGGDLAHTWVGSCRQEGSSLYARVRVTPASRKAWADPAVRSSLYARVRVTPCEEETKEEHPERPMTVTLTGSYIEGQAMLAGHAEDSDTVVNIQMHKAA